METCVLIPQDFSLVLTAQGAKNSRDQVASVWSITRIQQGTLCYPFQGTVRIDKLNIHSYVQEDDVSFYHKINLEYITNCMIVTFIYIFKFIVDHLLKCYYVCNYCWGYFYDVYGYC